MTNTFKIASYNIWFDRTIYLERTKSLCKYIDTINIDCICLQEVRPEIYKLLIMSLKTFPYHFPNEINVSYDCAIFSKYPISQSTNIKYPKSSMNRSLNVIKIDYPYNIRVINNMKTEQLITKNIEIVIATSHFESLFDKTFLNKEKIKQYEIANNALEIAYQTCKNVILCADTNIMVHEEKYFDELFEKSLWVDAWKIKGNDENKFTYDYLYNTYVNSNGGKFRSRLDRIIFKTNNCNLTQFDIILTPDIKKKRKKTNDEYPFIQTNSSTSFGQTHKEVEPSDHFGIYATFTVSI